MPTNNPKVSGYVPQHIYDCFKSFCDERSLSMSQAVVLILSERFELDVQVGQGSPSSSLLSEKLAQLEEQVSSLSSLQGTPVSELLSKVDFLTGRISTLEERLSALEQPKAIQPSPRTEAGSNHRQLDFIPTEPSSPSIEGTSLSVDLSELQSSSSSGLPKVLEPLTGKFLSMKRFGKSQGRISQWKKKNDPEAFYRWTKTCDPDSIGWKFVEEPVEGYLPADELSDELLGRLLEWIEDNKKS